MTKVKKKSKKRNPKQKSKEKKFLQKEDKQLIWFFAIIAIIFIGFLGAYFYVQSLKKFEYAGISFKEEKYGNLKFYHGVFPIIYDGVLYGYYNLYLRNDPRKNNISINTKFSFNKKIIFSLEPAAGNCYEASLAQVELGKFLRIFPWVREVEGAVNDEEIAKAMNLSYATCEHANENQTIIIVRKSDYPSIGKEKENCYYINVGNCENVKAAERFIIGVIAQINNVKV